MYIEVLHPAVTREEHPDAYDHSCASRTRSKIRFLKYYESKCFYCHEPLDTSTSTKDHFFPKSLGHVLAGNMVLACEACNAGKHDDLPCRDLVVAFVTAWCLNPNKYTNIYTPNEFYDQFHRDQYRISLLAYWFGEPNIPEVRSWRSP